MKSSDSILLMLGGAALLFLYSRTDEGEQEIDDLENNVTNTVTKTISAVRGIRNNNPGNIRIGEDWQGMSPTQSDSAFVQFKSMEYGIRAIAKILMTYQSKWHLYTIMGMINRWAPPNENATGAYVSSVAAFTEMADDEPIDATDPDVLFRLIRGIIRQENGVIAANFVSDDAVRNGISLALTS